VAVVALSQPGISFNKRTRFSHFSSTLSSAGVSSIYFSAPAFPTIALLYFAQFPPKLALSNKHRFQVYFT
jgi:hypothetical protein